MHNADCVAAIRERDAAYGESIPDHWQGPRDRRALLAELRGEPGLEAAARKVLEAWETGHMFDVAYAIGQLRKVLDDES